MSKLIENYIKQIDKDDIYNFALKNGIELGYDDVDVLIYYLKNKWQLIYKDKDKLIDEICNKLDENLSLKIKKLFYFYLDKYQNYL